MGYAVFRIFSLLNLALRQPFSTVSSKSLCLCKLPGYWTHWLKFSADMSSYTGWTRHNIFYWTLVEVLFFHEYFKEKSAFFMNKSSFICSIASRLFDPLTHIKCRNGFLYCWNETLHFSMDFSGTSFFHEYCKEKSQFFTEQLAIDLLTLKTLLLPFTTQRSTATLNS